MVALMEQAYAVNGAERMRLQQKLEELSRRLSTGKGGAEIARQSHDAIYLVVVRGEGGVEQGFCSAFAVDNARLVTNAHCVALAEDLRRRAGEIAVLQNGHPEVRLRVARMRRIRGFRPGAPGITPDVGWLEVEDKLPVTVALAEVAEARRVGTGDPMFTYGFPGRLADVRAPEATFVEGVVGRVTALDGRPGAPEEQQLIQHSAFTSGGTSGSPIFNAVGHVVAVNTGGYLDDARGHEAQAMVPRNLQGYNFGMRIDLVQALFSEADE
jgi:S1-C subfamily serine protease